MRSFAVCVERSKSYETKLTVGKIYEVNNEDVMNGLFRFLGDDNILHTAYTWRFLLLSDILEE